MVRRHVPKILVIKLSALGDFVLALAAMKKIRQAHSKAHISLLTTPPFEALAKASPYFNAVDIDGRPESLPDWIARARSACETAPSASSSTRPASVVAKPST